MKNPLESLHLFLVSFLKVKSNIKILSLISFFLMCLALYINLIYEGIILLLITLSYQLTLWVVPEDKWNKKTVK